MRGFGGREMNAFRKRYHTKLDELRSSSKSIAELVSTSIDQSVTALGELNVDLAREVIKNDQIVDDQVQKIENLCMELLALQQPMAKDLRMIIGILKIGIDLERIGDLAVDVARVTAQYQYKTKVTNVEIIPRMAEIGRNMLGQAIVALCSDDADLARQTTKWDYEIDGLYVEARDELLILIIENPEIISEGTSLLMVNRHLERIGDHICNICETIIYMVEAKREHLN
jgi:phosphate transport system protein